MSGLSQTVDNSGNEVIRYSIENGDYVEVMPETGDFSFHDSSGREIGEESQRQIMSELAKMADEIYIDNNFGTQSGHEYSEQIYRLMKARKIGQLRGIKKVCLHKNQIPLDAPRDPGPEVASFIAEAYDMQDTEIPIFHVIYAT